MIKEQRINIIMDEINRKGYLSMEDIAKKINVSVSTIRRDIKELETKVALERCARRRCEKQGRHLVRTAVCGTAGPV